TVLGELRRHFRDHTWPVRVPRRIKELYLEMSAVVESLGHALGRPPHVDEVADAMGATIDEVLGAMEAGAAYRPSGLTPPSDLNDDDPPSQEGVTLGLEDAALEGADTRVILHRLLRELPERERRVLYLRFFAGQTQAQIARDVGVSQVHVSRIIRA